MHNKLDIFKAYHLSHYTWYDKTLLPILTRMAKVAYVTTEISIPLYISDISTTVHLKPHSSRCFDLFCAPRSSLNWNSLRFPNYFVVSRPPLSQWGSSHFILTNSQRAWIRVAPFTSGKGQRQEFQPFWSNTQFQFPDFAFVCCWRKDSVDSNVRRGPSVNVDRR